MISIKAQVATEYLVIAGLVILIVIPLTFLYIKYTTESDYAITTAKVSSIANEISKLANSAYSYGQDTQLTIELDFPNGLESLEIPNTPGNKDIVFKVRDTQGDLVDIVKQAEVNIFTYGDVIPVTPGRKKLIVKSLGSSVLVQIPCEDTDPTQCVLPINYPGCTAIDPYECLIGCQNGAWTVIEICNDLNPICDLNNNQCGPPV